MKYKKINYKFVRGDTQPLEKFRLIDKNGNVLELTENDSIYFTIKQEDSDEAIVKKNLTDGIEKDSDGFYHITIESEDTEDLDTEVDYVYDIEFNLTINEKEYVATPVQGTIKLIKDVTEKGDR